MVTIKKQPTQTLAKALEVLNAFSTEQPERGIRELARDLDLNPTTVHRIVRTLTYAGFLEQNATNQNYSLGPKMMKLANIYASHNPLPSVARKVFGQFADRFAHNFYLGMLSQFEVIYLAVLDGRGPIKISVEAGISIPVHSTALGKVLLAFKSDAAVQEFLDRKQLTQFTPRTLSTPQVLKAQLSEIRVNKYAVNDGEQYDAVGSVAVPVFGQKGQPVNLAVSLSYPRHLVFDGSLNIMETIHLAQEISAEITHRCDVGHWITHPG